MDRSVALMRALQRRLAGWFDVIRRATGAQDLRFENHDDGSFSLVAEWAGGSRDASSFAKMFTREKVFGRSHALPSEAQFVERRACDHARDFIREILERRGVIG
jgi:hypothetical protein